MPLNPRQQRFVDQYIIDLNGTQAAIRAGYSPRTANEQASRLLAHASVRAAVDARTKVLADAADGSAMWIVEQAVRVVRLALDSETPDLRAAVPALALLARRHSDFSEKHDVQALIGVVVERRTPALDEED